MNVLPESETRTLLEKFELTGRTAQQHPTDGTNKPGVVATVDCTSDSGQSGQIDVTIAGHGARRQLPLSDHEATSLVEEFVGKGLLAGEAAQHAMVAHVFFRIARLVTKNPPIVKLHCANVHLHHSDFRIETVQIWVSSPLHVKPRLTEHAHDRS